ncbi:cobyrinate a,c-diamide synthase [Synechococcus sp. PCC 6312]|uniref:cobyrinate a,c-diamide synthase n=1 Tax=Synechococcus sp. (strain ATCC 27167 / PCC 6312) TaxID=195253 RepID=UPI00029F49AF|nr:cobyrinate a,c-diamide synthase [Synechococcus sp. PCC 6312]AFY60450.1 cobyrinic acid a,c-diamide synthase [Synechococcus sp. PCC 6312]
MSLIIAGERSGVGKTTVTLALLAALAQQNSKIIQSFKVGPDYIDPMFHRRLTGRPCRNLDVILTSETYVQDCFTRHTAACDYVVIEGVMGLFDGASSTLINPVIPWDRGSTAHIADLLQLPILLVVNAAGTSRSIAALVHGYQTYAPQLNIAGVVFNRVSSERHLELLSRALASLNMPLLGVFYRQADITIPDRHLGLVPTDELPELPALIQRLATLGQASFAWDQLLPLLAPPILQPLTSKLEISALKQEQLTSELQLSSSDPQQLTSELQLSSSDPQQLTSELQLSSSDPQQLTSELQLSSSDPQQLTSELQLSSSEPHHWTSELQLSSSEPHHLTSELQLLSSEPHHWTSELQLSSSEPHHWTSELQLSSSEPHHLTSELQLLSSEPQYQPEALCRLAIAQDAAFNFYYADNLDILESVGFELVAWSPLADTSLPDNIHGLYLGGGFPEMFAAELSANQSLIQQLHHLISQGLPAYAECGGLMYLCQAIVDFEQHSHPMLGILPTTAQMGKRLTLGYRHVQPNPGLVNALIPDAQIIVGHEFHRSTLTTRPTLPLYHLTHYDGSRPQTEGWQVFNVYASYVHLHFGGCLSLPKWFLNLCQTYYLKQSSNCGNPF